MSDKGMTTIALKKINKNKVYHFIYKEKVTSKQQIVQKLQMGLSTVSQNLKILEDEGLIEKNGYFDSTGGRKAHAIQIVRQARISIGIGILKNMVLIASIDLYGEVILSSSLPLSYEPENRYYQQLGEEIRHFIVSNKLKDSAILGVSIATQGIISPDGESVNYGVIMDNSRMRLSDFTAHIPYPCRLEHDSKAAAYLELWNHPQLDSATVFLLNHNLGGAIICSHSVHQGMEMHSGTIEHLCVDPDGPLCYCGSHGCLETYCSANALETAAGIPLADFFEKLRSSDDSEYQPVWKNYLDHLAFAMRNLCMIVDCTVIISGYLAPYFTEDDIAYLLDQMNRNSPFTFTQDRIILGTHGQFTPAIGAALYYVDEFLGNV